MTPPTELRKRGESPANPSPANDSSERAGDGLTPSLPPDRMVQTMLGQLVLDHVRVKPYLHVEVPANVPLTVFAIPSLAQGATGLSAGGATVRVVGNRADARFAFTGRENLGSGRVRVAFEVASEGVVGHVDLLLRDSVWEVADDHVIER